jgi:hypothetical protein
LDKTDLKTGEAAGITGENTTTGGIEASEATTITIVVLAEDGSGISTMGNCGL